MNEIEIGPIDRYASLPAEVRLDRDRYYLVDNDGYKLFSRVCPHAGAMVELEDGEFVCPMHGWTFEADTGRCHNVPSAKLASYEVVLRDGVLYALMP
ncbi:Rieske (2Fe-2S) protein [Paenibacillus flagellatus]|uniref:2Fe-2S ferredoxin n=1 Tax=Paenibacillus flagellatus TaxID=2211139 RepID=A0A2V5JYB5_9BACL|nr:Rieske (2Fe-2S) protein [Paenibacillus flagellatus]PYI51869.1 2Fe-2S ferredoxin [Paenibacillus flagellatus]